MQTPLVFFQEIKVKGQTVQPGECTQTDKRTEGRMDATKYIISLLRGWQKSLNGQGNYGGHGSSLFSSETEFGPQNRSSSLQKLSSTHRIRVHLYRNWVRPTESEFISTETEFDPQNQSSWKEILCIQFNSSLGLKLIPGKMMMIFCTASEETLTEAAELRICASSNLIPGVKKWASMASVGNSMVTVLQKKFLVQWRKYHDFVAT